MQSAEESILIAVMDGETETAKSKLQSFTQQEVRDLYAAACKIQALCLAALR